MFSAKEYLFTFEQRLNWRARTSALHKAPPVVHNLWESFSS